MIFKLWGNIYAMTLDQSSDEHLQITDHENDCDSIYTKHVLAAGHCEMKVIMIILASWDPLMMIGGGTTPRLQIHIYARGE